MFNAHVEVDESGDEMVFLRRVSPGASLKSYGIQVGQLAGLPKSVLDRAHDVLEQLEADSADQLPPLLQRPDQTLLFAFDPPVSKQEQTVLDRVRKMNVMGTTPLEALKVLSELHDALVTGTLSEEAG